MKSSLRRSGERTIIPARVRAFRASTSKFQLQVQLHDHARLGNFSRSPGRHPNPDLDLYPLETNQFCYALAPHKAEFDFHLKLMLRTDESSRNRQSQGLR